jgi:catechol 2,3-dioxygenase
MSFVARFGDIAHLGHIELLTPRLEASASFFMKTLGLCETARCGESIYLRAWGDYESCTLKLTQSKRNGLGHAGLRVRSPEALEQLAASLTTAGVPGQWTGGDVHHGRTFRCVSPDGHNVELYFDTQKYKPDASTLSRYKNMPQRRVHAISPLRLDHLNLLVSDVPRNRVFYQELLGMKLTEQIVFDDGTEMGAWVTSTNKAYDIAMTRDMTGSRGRLHHITYFMEAREDILKMADLLIDAGVFVETGPHKHTIGQTFFLYCYEPGGNRFEFASGGYSIFDPDWKPVVWTEAERKLGQAWGLKTIESFHTYGTPPVESDLESNK